MVGKDATSAYNDVALACVAFTLFMLLQAWDQYKDSNLLIPIGLVAGFGYAIKYTGGVAILYALAFVGWKTWRRRGCRPVLTVALAAGVVALPWVVKNWIWLQNPAAPLFNNWFPNPYVTSWFEDNYRQYLTTYELISRWQIPWAVTVKGQLAGILGPAFLLAPVALLALRRPEGRQLLLAMAVFGSTYFGNIGARFLIPPLPFLALAMMLGLGSHALALALALMHAVLSWPALIPRYALPGAWVCQEIPYRYAMRFRPQAEYLTAHLPQYGIDVLIDRVTEPGATVFTYQAIPDAYTSRRVLVEYEAASNHIDAQILWTGFLPAWRPTGARGFRFRASRCSASNSSRKPPANPSGASMNCARSMAPRTASRRLGFDRPSFSLGHRKCLGWEPRYLLGIGRRATPGQLCRGPVQIAPDARFGAARNLAQSTELRLQLFGETAPGQWKLLAADPDIFNANVPDLRRAAVAELKRRGIGYVLLFDNDEVARAVREGAETAGITEVGQSSGARLYRLQ